MVSCPSQLDCKHCSDTLGTERGGAWSEVEWSEVEVGWRENHSYVATVAERIRNSTHWILTLN